MGSLGLTSIGATCCDRLVSRGYDWAELTGIDRINYAVCKMSLAKATALSLLRQISKSTPHCRTASNAVVVSGFLLSVAIYFLCQFVGFVLLGWLSVFYLRRSVLLVWTLSRAGYAGDSGFRCPGRLTNLPPRPSLARNTCNSTLYC